MVAIRPIVVSGGISKWLQRTELLFLWSHHESTALPITLLQEAMGVPSLFNPLAAREGAALRAVMERLTLILAERAWYAPAAPEPKLPPADPW